MTRGRRQETELPLDDGVIDGARWAGLVPVAMVTPGQSTLALTHLWSTGCWRPGTVLLPSPHHVSVNDPSRQ